MRRFSQLVFALVLIPASVLGQKLSPLEKAINNNETLKAICIDYGQYQVQIIYSQINRDKKNSPKFKTYSYGVNDHLYFYPASTVKMPTAFLALQKLNELNVKGLDKDTNVKIGANRFPQTAVSVDTSSITGLPSIANYIKKIFLVSDNDAFNRLYEFVGQQYLNSELEKLNYKNSRISHRLVGGYDGIENKFTNPFWFYSNDGVVYEQLPQESQYDFSRFNSKEKNSRGKGYMTNDGEIVMQPFDFSNKNFIGLHDLHNMLKAVMFPDSVAQPFNLNKEDYRFLYKWMSALPKESQKPTYNYADNYVKFFMYGDLAEDQSIPRHIKIFNKVGFAYGFLTDVAYIADEENGVEFLLAASIHVSENEIYNDGVYEYDSVGIPFLAELGREIYHLELERKRKHKPDLSTFFNP